MALLLYLIAYYRSNFHRFLGITKLDKLTFLAESKLTAANLRGFNYTFVRWDRGPLSSDIYDDLATLKAGAAVVSQDDIALTDRGRDVVAALEPLVSGNPQVKRRIESVVREYGDLWTDALVKKVYDEVVEFPLRRMRVKEVPRGRRVLEPVPLSRAASGLVVDDDWRETIEILLDPEAHDSLKRAIESASREGYRPLEGQA